MTVRFLDPRPEPPAGRGRAGRRALPVRPSVVGLVANGYRDADRFVGELATLLRRRCGAEVIEVAKHTAASPLGAAERERLVACDLVVAAWGH